MISINRIKAIFIKEIQDVKSNTSVIYMFFLPIVLTILWDQFMADMPTGYALAAGLMFLVVMVGMYVPSMIIAEEKEKNTMGVLVLSPATPTEVFIGKGLFTFISVIIVTFIMILITGVSFSYLPIILISTILASISSIFLGMIVGLLSKDQKATGVIGTPIYLILLIFPLYGNMGVNFMTKISKALPTYYYFDILNRAFAEGQLFMDLLFQMGMLMIYIAVTFIALYISYQHKGIK
ncbi:MAG: ABC transporter permease [Halothermotrichaceae bacterium]